MLLYRGNNKDGGIFMSYKKRMTKFKYTLSHKKAFLKIEKELTGKNTLAGYLHDLDKLILYMFTPIPLKQVHEIHRLTARHHVNDIKKTKEDYIQMVIDWECARYTKPDKPLTAYGTMKKYYPETEFYIHPILKELKLIA